MTKIKVGDMIVSRGYVHQGNVPDGNLGKIKDIHTDHLCATVTGPLYLVEFTSIPNGHLGGWLLLASEFMIVT